MLFNMQNQFVEIPASKQSLARRRPVYGLGVNDSDYITKQLVDGKYIRCPYYEVWTSMLERCYSDKYQAKHLTYIDCSVCDAWLTFSNFKSWMEIQDWQGKELDKDIRVKGNKVYAPSTCRFVTRAENNIEAQAKHYVFVSPLGEVVQIYNLSEFCRDNGLNQSSMSGVNSGKRKQHKGWLSTNKEK